MAAGRLPRGVEARGKTIRLTFWINGARFREALDLGPTPPNIRYVDRMLRDIERKIELGTFRYAEYFPNSKRLACNPALAGSPLTVREFAHRWLRAQGSLAKSTRQGYREALDSFWLPAFGDRALESLTLSEILGKLDGHAWRTRKTRNNNLIPMRRLLDLAFIDGLLKVDLAARLKYLKPQREPADPLSIDEVDTVLASMAERYQPSVVNYFEFAFFSGLRTSELIALRWGDIDWGRRTVRVQRAKVRGEIKPTKTYQVRDVEALERAFAALRRQKALTFLAGPEVFHSPFTDAPYIDDQTPRKCFWHPALKLCGIRERDAYQTRHTFASYCLMHGANPAWLARQLGHSTTEMVFRVYARWIDGADKSSERAKLDAALANRVYRPNTAPNEERKRLTTLNHNDYSGGEGGIRTRRSPHQCWCSAKSRPKTDQISPQTVVMRLYAQQTGFGV